MPTAFRRSIVRAVPSLVAALGAAGCGGGPAPDAAAVAGPGAERIAASTSPLRTCVTIGRGLAGDLADTQIGSGAAAGVNFGSSLAMIAGLVNGSTRRALVRPDVSSIPAGATIDSATLTLTARAPSGGWIETHRVLVPWAEGSATWDSFFASSTAPYETTYPPTVWGGSGPVAIDVTSLVAAWTSGTPNHGVLLANGPVSNANFYTSEDASAAVRPRLDVCYTTGACAGITCAATDVCHAAGTCDPATGQCSNPVVLAGAACVAAMCADGRLDGAEDAVDCGGDCAPCPTAPDGESGAVPGGVQIRAVPTCGSATTCTSPYLDIQLVNTNDSPMDVEIVLVASGLDGRTAERSLGAHAIAAGATLSTTAEASLLPVQSVGSTSWGVVRARFGAAGASPASAIAAPFFYDFAPGYGAVTMYGLAQASTRFSTAGPQATAHGRVWNATSASMVDVAALPSDPDVAIGPASFALGDGLPPAVLGLPPSGGTMPPNTGTRVCTQWQALYVDSESGGDYLAGPAGTAFWQPAAGALSMLQNAATQAVVWAGPLDAGGCTPALALNGSYVLRQTTQIKKNATQFDVVQHHDPAPNDPTTWDKIVETSTQFSVTPNKPVVTLKPWVWSSATNVAAVVAQMLRNADPGLPAKTMTVRADQSCPTKPVDHRSCFDGASTVYLAPGNAIGTLTPDAYWKFLVAHELGHQIVAAQATIALASYDMPDDVGVCNCDHIGGSTLSHCPTSREAFSVALVEGFATFEAYKAFNDTSQGDCQFVGWLPSYFPGWPLGGLPPSSSQPPVAGICGGATSFRKANCSSKPNTGVESDWAEFLWSVHTKTANKLDMPTLFAIHQNANGSGSWSKVQSGASAVLGGPMSPKYLHYVQTAQQFAVDDSY